MRLFVPALVVTAVTAAASNLTPPVLPLIVRNPYLSTWLASARKAPWESWPIFWTGRSLGFSAMASVPGSSTVYPLLGRPQDQLSSSDAHYAISYPTYLGASFDASTTNLSYQIDAPQPGDEPLQLTLSFLSPITPSSTLRQAIPAAYLSVIVEGSFNVNVYLDVNGEWVSGNRDNSIRWSLSDPLPEWGTSSAIPFKTWSFSRSEPQLFTEHDDRGEWGTLHFSAPADAHHASAPSADLRATFARSGALPDRVESEFRPIAQGDPAFAFSKSFRLGDFAARSSSSSKVVDSATFTLAFTQDPVVQYASARGLTLMRPLWASYFDSAEDLVSYHYADFSTSAALAQNYSDSLAADAFESGSQDYQDILALSARQVLGATQFAGTLDNPILFLKEISSNGNFQTVDVIFPAFPFFLYTNPQWLAYLLEPLIEHQLSGQYPNDYSMHDLGAHFPNATGHADGKDEYMPVEECGNMLIMGLAVANAMRYDTKPAFMQAQGGAHALQIPGAQEWAQWTDGVGINRAPDDMSAATGRNRAEKWLSRSYKLWKQWTGYLVRESLIPHNQLSTDDFAGWLANQTNLALKGIVGIRAMAEIADLVGQPEDAKYYRRLSEEYIDKWQGFAVSRDQTHAKLAYTWYGSWTTTYNLFADSLLCFHVPGEMGKRSGPAEQAPMGVDDEEDVFAQPDTIGSGREVLIPDHIYQMQSDWYHAVLQRYGLPLDSRHLYTKSDWEFFAAAVAGRETRKQILTAVAGWVNETSTDRPFTDLYETEGDGGFPGIYFMARPVVGGHFAFLALAQACGGKALEQLRFLDARAPRAVDVQQALAFDVPAGWVMPESSKPTPFLGRRSPDRAEGLGGAGGPRGVRRGSA